MKEKFSKLITGIIITTSILLLTSCSNQSTTPQQHHANPSVALVTDASDANSNPYNAAAIAGLKKYAKDHNINYGDKGYEVFTPNYSSQIYSLIDQAAQRNFHLVIGSSQNAIKDNAKLYPKTNFVIIGGKVNNQKNVTNIIFQSQQAAYLAGIVAAKTTKTNIIGFIGSTEPTSTKFKNGFIQGIQAQAKKDHKNIKILSQNTNTFSNTTIGQNIAQAMYLKKADIIFAATGESGNGVFTAARKINEAQPVNQKVWVIGVDTDQTNQGDYYAKGGQKSNFTLTSVTNNIALAIKNIANSSYNDKFPGNKTTTYSLKNNGVDIVQSSNISYNTWITVQKVRQKILNEKIKIK